MIFWFFIITLTASAVLAVLLPLARPAGRLPDGHSHDRAVYLDQLTELERDRRDGRIGVDESDAARAEIVRRLLAVDAEARARAEAMLEIA